MRRSTNPRRGGGGSKTLPARARSSRRSLFAVAVMGASFAGSGIACSSDSTGDSAKGTKVPDCLDYDGDHYGAGCVVGPDCNDQDPTIHDACDDCSKPAEGCPCSREGFEMACGVATGQGSEGTTCVFGARRCIDGEWTSCDLSSPSPITQTRGLGSTDEDCGDPCDPYCKHYDDEPDDTLTDPEIGRASCRERV